MCKVIGYNVSLLVTFLSPLLATYLLSLITPPTAQLTPQIPVNCRQLSNELTVSWVVDHSNKIHLHQTLWMCTSESYCSI